MNKDPETRAAKTPTTATANDQPKKLLECPGIQLSLLANRTKTITAKPPQTPKEKEFWLAYKLLKLPVKEYTITTNNSIVLKLYNKLKKPKFHKRCYLLILIKTVTT